MVAHPEKSQEKINSLIPDLSISVEQYLLVQFGDNALQYQHELSAVQIVDQCNSILELLVSAKEIVLVSHVTRLL